MSDLGEQVKVVASAAPKSALPMVLAVLLHAVVIAGAVVWWLTHPLKPQPLDIELVVVSEGLDIDIAAPDQPTSNDAPVTQNTAPPLPSAATEPPVPSPPVHTPPPALALPVPAPPTPVAPAPVAPAVRPSPPKPAPSPPVAAAPSLPAPPSAIPPGQSGAGINGPAGGGDIAQLSAPPPVYPAAAKRRGEEGRVIVRAEIDTDGLPRNVEVETSSGFKTLDDAAVEAVKTWRFRNSSGRSVGITAPIRFALRADERR